MIFGRKSGQTKSPAVPSRDKNRKKSYSMTMAWILLNDFPSVSD
jgi:hypothetical protein